MGNYDGRSSIATEKRSLIAGEERANIHSGSRVIFRRRPRCKFLVTGGIPRPRLYLKTDHARSPGHNGVPDAGREIHTPDVTLRRFPAQAMPLCNRAAAIEKNDVRGSFQYKKRLRFRGIGMTMRADVSVFQQHVQKSMRIVRGPRVEIVVHPEAGRHGCTLCDRIKQ